jgi:hypothetical protein
MSHNHQRAMQALTSLATIETMAGANVSYHTRATYLEISGHGVSDIRSESIQEAISDLAWKLLQVRAQLEEVLGPAFDLEKTQVLPRMKLED